MLPLLLPHAICIALDAAHTPACNGKLTAILTTPDAICCPYCCPVLLSSLPLLHIALVPIDILPSLSYHAALASHGSSQKMSVVSCNSACSLVLSSS